MKSSATSMFNCLLAIDVVERIPDFHARMRAFTAHEPITLKSADDLTSLPQRERVDGIVISIHQALNEEILLTMPKLRYIGILGTSVKKIPAAWCARNSIAVSNITEYCDDDTAEWVIMKALEYFRKGTPARSAMHKNLGVIGVGAVGMRVIEMARALHMHVVYNSRTEHADFDALGVKAMSKEDIFRHADIVSIHTPAFLSWLDAHLLRIARNNLCIIDTCMGRISVGNDLETMLQERRDITVIMDKIAGDNYPELKGRAQIHAESAFLTVDAEKRLVDKFFDNLGAFLKT